MDDFCPRKWIDLARSPSGQWLEVILLVVSNCDEMEHDCWTRSMGFGECDEKMSEGNVAKGITEMQVNWKWEMRKVVSLVPGRRY
jgi:hypothetical protein